MNLLESLKQHMIEQATDAQWLVAQIAVGASPEKSLVTKAVMDQPAVNGIVAGLHPIIFADLGPDLEKARSAWAVAQRQAAVARTTFAADKGEDIILVLVGPAGSRHDGEWNALAMEIERNDLVCRKLVWLPAHKQPLSPDSLREFTRRTFISKPWLATSAAQPLALDQLTTENLGLGSWQKILDAQPVDRAAVDYDELVKELSEAELP